MLESIAEDRKIYLQWSDTDSMVEMVAFSMASMLKTVHAFSRNAIHGWYVFEFFCIVKNFSHFENLLCINRNLQEKKLWLSALPNNGSRQHWTRTGC